MDKSDYVEFTSKRPLDCGNGKYVVQLDNEATWISAWDSGYKLSYHGTNRIMFKCEISSAYALGLQCGGTVTDDFYVWHGFIMWGCWTIIGLLQIYSNRYLRSYWRCHRTLHYITGTLAVLVITASALFALSKNNWKILKTTHTIAGFITFILAVLLGLGGIFAAVTLKYSTNEWDTLRFVKGKAVHKVFGLGLTIGS